MPDSFLPPLAQQLVDAQVAYHLDQLTGVRLEATVRQLAEDVLDGAGQHQLEELVDREVVAQIVVRALRTVPGSAALGGIVDLATAVAHDGPAKPYPLGEVVDRERVEAVLDELLALHPVLERALDRLVDSPLVGTTAARFMGRIAGEVLQANKAVADKVPGLGSLMSLGTSAASRAMGAADKQFEALIGGTVGKGSAFAVRRLNKIVIETVQDPTTREALLQVWDLMAREPVAGLGRYADHGEIAGVVDAVHELAVTALATDRAAEAATVVVEGFFDRFGGYTPTELLGELDLDREELVADLVRVAPAVVDALRSTGDLERIIRGHLEPFFASPEVAELLS